MEELDNFLLPFLSLYLEIMHDKQGKSHIVQTIYTQENIYTYVYMVLCDDLVGLTIFFICSNACVKLYCYQL